MGRTALLSIAFVFSMAQAAPYQPGRLIDPVACAADPSQTYALYLPST